MLCQGIEIYPCVQFYLPQCSLSVTCTYMSPFITYSSRLVVVTFKDDTVHRVTELHLSMFVSAPVSELCESKQNKRNSVLTLFLGI